MGIGVAVFLIAVGAVLTFAVHVTTTGFNLHTIGIILMIAGALGLIVTMTVFAPRRRAVTVHERTVSRDPLVAGNAVVQDRVVDQRDAY